MRTTIRLPDDLLREAKRKATESGTTLTRLIADALREMLARRDDDSIREPIRLETYCGNGLRPGVDLDDTAALLERMEADDAGGTKA